MLQAASPPARRPLLLAWAWTALLPGLAPSQSFDQTNHRHVSGTSSPGQFGSTVGTKQALCAREPAGDGDHDRSAENDARWPIGDAAMPARAEHTRYRGQQKLSA